MTDIEHSIVHVDSKAHRRCARPAGMHGTQRMVSTNSGKAYMGAAADRHECGWVFILSTVGGFAEDGGRARAAGPDQPHRPHKPTRRRSGSSIMTDNVSAGQIAAEELIRTGCT